MASASLPLLAVGAFVGGLGQAISTPSSSHLLGRLAPPRLAPLVFSIKQTGVPVGLMLGGVVAPAGRIGATTGAVLAFGDAGALSLPLLFSAALSVTGDYAPGFLIGGALTLGYGVVRPGAAAMTEAA